MKMPPRSTAISVTTITLHPHRADQASFELHTRTGATTNTCPYSSFASLALPGSEPNELAGSGALGVTVCDGYLGVTPVVYGSLGHT
ncbi:MAG TPA: hypothetical protein VFN21_10185 [Acidimicrobiales bacterium]|nr:hypothetical protein [Acidimicrobiales bacterium]